MLGLNDEQQIEHARIEFGVIVLLDHIEEVLGNGLLLQRMADIQALPLHRVAVDVVSVGDDGRELRDQIDRLPHQVVARDVIGIGVKRIHLEYATGQDIHDIGALEVNQMHDGAMVERHILIDKFLESFQFLFVRQVT